MILIPAIDIINGCCVRLYQGNYEKKTQYSNDVLTTARQWQDEGASWLHVVDLDGARSGRTDNFATIATIARQLPQLHIEVGGGIRTVSSAQAYLDSGVERIIVGSKAISEPGFLFSLAEQFPHQIALGLDAKSGMVMTEGWQQQSQIQAEELLNECKHLPLASVIYTDISRDGTLSGANLQATSALAGTTDIPLYASGGIGSMEDIHELCRYKEIAGAILGKALYEKTIDFAQAQDYVKRNCPC